MGPQVDWGRDHVLWSIGALSITFFWVVEERQMAQRSTGDDTP